MAGPNFPTHIAPSFPLKIAKGRYKVLGVNDLTEVVDQNIKMVLLTVPGERLFDNKFGIGLSRYLFLNEFEVQNGLLHPNDPNKSILPLRSNIISQINKYLPYITIQDLDLSFNENLIGIKFKYFINDSSATATFNYVIQGIDY